MSIKWIPTKLVKIKKWNSTLFSIIINAEIEKFIPGQFAQLSFFDKKRRIKRAYSYVNAPSNKNIEFYIISIPNGSFTSKLKNLKNKNPLMISKKSFGFFTLNEIPSAKFLWMFATGTAIGPYLSILQEKDKNLKRFKKIILIYAVKKHNHLSYFSKIKKLQKKYKKKLIVETILSREKKKNFLQGRIPNLLENLKIEEKIGIPLTKKNSQVMLCGNPGMVKDTQIFLIKNRKMKKNLRRKKGNITSENYW